MQQKTLRFPETEDKYRSRNGLNPYEKDFEIYVEKK